MNLTDIIKGPIVTEKLERVREELHQYSFLVDRQATKGDIGRAVEKLFKVDVVAVRTSIARGKTKRIGKSIGRRPNWKRAIVTLGEGQKIGLFESD